jgi:hypothetical protein
MIGFWVEPRPTGSFEVVPIADSDKVVLEYWGNAGAAVEVSVQLPFVNILRVVEKRCGAILDLRKRSYPRQPL